MNRCITTLSQYLNHGLCEDLLINLQDGILDLLIRDTERSQENSFMRKHKKHDLLNYAPFYA